MPDLKRKYEITRPEDKFDVATAVRDIGDKQVTPPEFVAGQSHIGVQMFLSRQMVDNPTVETSHKEEAWSNTKTATVTTLHSESVA
jgi:hypothetical protein